MAQPENDKKRRKNKRKLRTEVPSPSSSDGETPTSQAYQKRHTATANDNTDTAQVIEGENDTSTLRGQVPGKTFDEFYLEQVTKEFANDLDKLRSAGDFNSQSVPLLVRALQQGNACFTQNERHRIDSTKPVS